jgi:hypothetical protein
MRNSPAAAFQIPVHTIPYSIKFSPGDYPSKLILREVDGIKSPPAERYGRARRAVLKRLFRELRLVCASAVIQCCPTHPLHSAYERQAAENRNRSKSHR